MSDFTKRLSPNFTVGEMLVSATAARKGIRNDRPSEAILGSLAVLCEMVLEPVRRHYARPVVITSGYRSPRLNVAVGGSATSQHCRGEAADFTVPGVSNKEVCEWIRDSLRFDQLIYEFGEGGWAHCSFGPRMRNQTISAKRIRGKTQYLPGLVS